MKNNVSIVMITGDALRHKYVAHQLNTFGSSPSRSIRSAAFLVAGRKMESLLTSYKWDKLL